MTTWPKEPRLISNTASMTTIQSMASNSDDMLVCPICLEQYTVPRALPCLHTFCENCLTNWVQHNAVNSIAIGSRSQRNFPCPVCKDDITVPANGIQGFRHNFFISNLAEAASVNEEKKARSTSRESGDADAECLDLEICCNRCEEQGVWKLCIKCNEWLCPHCCQDHKRLKATKHHILATLSELCEGEFNCGDIKIAQDDFSKCTKQQHSCMNCYYCSNCKLLTCKCQLGDCHQVHNVVNLAEGRNFEEMYSMLTTYITKLGNCELALDEQKRMISNEDKIINRKKKNVLDRVIARLKKDFLNRINLRMASAEENLHARLDVVSNNLFITQTVEQEIQHILKTQSKKDIVAQAPLLCQQAEQCLDDNKEGTKVTMIKPLLKDFEENTLETHIAAILDDLLGFEEYEFEPGVRGVRDIVTVGSQSPIPNPGTQSATTSAGSATSYSEVDTTIPFLRSSDSAGSRRPRTSPYTAINTQATTGDDWDDLESPFLRSSDNVDDDWDDLESHQGYVPTSAPSDQRDGDLLELFSTLQTTEQNSSDEANVSEQSGEILSPPSGPFYPDHANEYDSWENFVEQTSAPQPTLIFHTPRPIRPPFFPPPPRSPHHQHHPDWHHPHGPRPHHPRHHHRPHRRPWGRGRGRGGRH